MPGYHFYQPVYRMGQKIKPGISADDVLQIYLHESWARGDMIGRDVCFNEWSWKNKGSIWFLEDDEVIDFILNSKFDSVSMKDIKSFDAPIMLSYPNKVGEVFKGVLVRRLNVKRRREDLARFYNHFGISVSPEDFSPMRGTEGRDDEELVEFVFSQRDSISPDGVSRLRFIVPESRFESALNGEWFDDPKTYDQTKYWLTSGDIETQKIHFKIGLRAMLYAQAFPESLVPGLPTRKQMMGRAENVKTFYFRKAKVHGTSPCLHLRSAHSRVLRNERYRRNHDGSPREVPVKLTVVSGHDVDPKVLKLMREELIQKVINLQKENAHEDCTH